MCRLRRYVRTLFTSTPQTWIINKAETWCWSILSHHHKNMLSRVHWRMEPTANWRVPYRSPIEISAGSQLSSIWSWDSSYGFCRLVDGINYKKEQPWAKWHIVTKYIYVGCDFWQYVSFLDSPDHLVSTSPLGQRHKVWMYKLPNLWCILETVRA